MGNGKSEMGNDFQIGLIGAGYIADWHAKALRANGLRAAAVCDRDGFKAKALADQHGIAKHFTSIEQMLAECKLDAVHVLLPPQLHAMAARLALSAGVHVLMEKPMATSVADCDAIVSLAIDRGLMAAVSHNFCFTPVYQRLCDDIASGSLGLIDDVRVTWAKQLGQLSFGPFGHWMFERPGHVMLEIGPHSVANALHLAMLCAQVNGEPAEGLTRLDARAAKPLDLPGGKLAYRRWVVDAEAGSTRVAMEWSFVPGFDRHAIEVRGSLGNATCDLDRNVYTAERHTAGEVDFDRHAVLRRTSRDINRQARGNLLGYFASKAKLSRTGNTFGASIAESVRTFYAGLRDRKTDPRLAATFGRDVVATCWQIADAAVGRADERPTSLHVAASPSRPADALVLGGSGFIGRALVRKLAEAGKHVRVVSRSPVDLGLPADLADRVEVVRGDMRNAAELDQLLPSVRCVFHLARANGKTWAEWHEQDVLATKLLAEKCLEHKVGRLIYTSTISALDRSDPGRTISDNDPAADPDVVRELYSRTKAANERLLMELHKSRGLDVAIFRPGIVLGPGGPPFHLGVARWSFNRVARYWGRGDTPLPIVLVDDVADALVAAMDAPGIAGKAFNLVAESSLTAREYVAELERFCRVKFEAAPGPIWRTYAGELAKWVVKVAVRHQGERRVPRYAEWKSRAQLGRFACENARTLLNWRPASDRETIVRVGIHAPAREFVLHAAGVGAAERREDATPTTNVTSAA